MHDRPKTSDMQYIITFIIPAKLLHNRDIVPVHFKPNLHNLFMDIQLKSFWF